MNCTKEECAKIVEKYWQREWEKIKQIDFPKTREYEVTDVECCNELKALKTGIKSNKTPSKTIIKMHPSMRYANRKRSMSPYNFWQSLKTDPEKFKTFYENRLRCSDWFKEKNGKNFHYLQEGYVPEFIYGIGMSTSRKAPLVSYFKPALAKNLILKYLNEYKTIFDPCCGYSGRLIGSVCAGKDYIGYDINDITVEECTNVAKYIQPLFPDRKVQISEADSLNSKGMFSCMLTCTPYADIEEWQSSTGKITCNLSCDEWIDRLIENYRCEKYIFVVDNNITKYRQYIVEELENTSHFGSNKEYVVMICNT